MTNAVSLAQYGSTGVSQGFKNRIINGAMVIDQRNAGASVTPSNQFTLDRWCAIVTQASKFTVQQNAGSVTPPVGFTNYLGITSTSAYSVASGDTFFIYQAIEGFNFADMQWGTANAKTITLSFWVRSSLTGTFGGALSNEAGNRSYPFSYTISAANTWEQKSVTIAGDTTGTWAGATNGTGVNVRFGLGSGATFSATAGAWGAGNIVQATGNVSVVGTNGATFYITGVQLEVGSTATSFDYRPYGTELQLCYRYYYRLVTSEGEPICNAVAYNGATGFGVFVFPVTMRTAPDIDQTATSNQFNLTGNAGTQLFTNFGYNERGANTITLYNANTVSITQGYGYWFRDNSSVSGAKLAFTAEI